jgi:hypothetical protein
MVEENVTGLAGTPILQAYVEQTNQQSIFLMSLLLFFGTCLVSFLFKEFRNSPFFPTVVRGLVSDFAVVIAIIGMAGVDMLAGVATPKLLVPEKFAPTHPDRGWLINPMLKNPLWSIFAASLPAILATILIFMDQQITAVIINRKDHKLKVRQRETKYKLWRRLESYSILAGITINITERMRLPSGSLRTELTRNDVLSPGYPMVRGSYGREPHQHQFPQNGL